MVKEPWGEGKTWKTKAAFMSWLRGGIRRALWNRSPIKIEFINKHRKRIPNPNPKGKAATVWGGECAVCHKDFVQSELNVDHVIGGHSLREIEDIQKFIEGIVIIDGDTDLQFICLGCHKIKNLAEKSGVSFEEATKRKKVIAFGKLSVDEQAIILYNEGIETVGKTKAARVKQYQEKLK